MTLNSWVQQLKNERVKNSDVKFTYELKELDWPLKEFGIISSQ